MSKIAFYKAPLFFFLTIGHPTLFLIYIYIAETYQYYIALFPEPHLTLISRVPPNIGVLNLAIFIPAMIFMGVITILLHFGFIKLWVKINFFDFLNKKLSSNIAFIVTIFSYFNLLNWVTGMEYNIMGFIFAPLLILLSFLLLIKFIIETIVIIKRY